MKTRKNHAADTAPAKAAGRRRLVETAASVGMLMLAIGMFLPLLNLLSVERLPVFKWVFSVGALLYWGARCVDVSAPGESMRLRRLRRMEFWAGACFGVAAFFWFYNGHKFEGIATVGPLTILRDTILFSLAGAVLQILAAWLIYFRQKKEASRAS